MNNSFPVSIVIPTFNRAEYLIQCIDSCLAQTKQCEIIVCDHGSTDNTPEVASRYGDKIKYIRRELDSGVHFCWLDGILHSKSDLIHLNFDDDWIEPTFIERCSNLFDAKVGCVLSKAKIFHEEENRFQERAFFKNIETGVYKSSILIKHNFKDLTSPCAGIFRKEILIDNLFQGKVPFSRHNYHGVGPDLLFSLFSGKRYPNFGFVNENLAIFRSHNNSITVDSNKSREKQDKIYNAYNDSRIYYTINNLINQMGLYYIAKIITKIKQRW